MPMTLELAPVVNGAARREDLIAAGVPVPPGEEQWLDERDLPDINIEYDAPHQRLLITVPPEQLGHQYIGAPARERPRAASGRGALFNYDLYTSHQSDYRYASLWHEARGFGDYGVVSSTGRWRRMLSDADTDNGQSSYMRYDSWWRFHDTDSMLTWQVGDMISGSLAWSRSVRMGGVQFSRNFSLRPDLITYPLPTFNGTSAVPGTVDLFVNGYRSRSLEVDPGPFTLTDVPYINGAGEAVVVTEDAQGRRVATTVPFYVTSDLLEAGLADYDLSIGALRRNYARRSMDYGTGAASGVYRYGLNDTLTLETHAELADELGLAGVGSVMRLGRLGVLNLAVSQSQHEKGSGRQQSMGYQYTRRGFNMGVQHSQREGDFSDLSGIGLEDAVYGRRSTQATISTALGGLGSISAGYFDTRSVDDTRTRLLNLSWNRSLWQRSNLFVSGNRALDGDGWSITAQLVLPLGQLGTLSSGVERLPGDGGSRQRLEYDRPAPVSGGAGLRVGYDRTSRGEDYRRAEVSWRGDRVETRVGAFGDRDNTTWWGEATGAVVAIDGDVLLSRQINDAFILVSTEGEADIPVNYEHRMIGRTDGRGHRLIPWVTPWYQAMVDIDTMALPPDMQAEHVRQPVSVRAGSGRVLRFPIHRVRAAGIRLELADGEPVPLGSLAERVETGDPATVGYDGLVYFEQLSGDERLRITTPEGRTCAVSFSLPDDDGLHTLGPYRCQPLKPERAHIGSAP